MIFARWSRSLQQLRATAGCGKEDDVPSLSVKKKQGKCSKMSVCGYLLTLKHGEETFGIFQNTSQLMAREEERQRICGICSAGIR